MLSPAEREQFKVKILEVVDGCKLRPWRAKDLQQSLGLAHHHIVSLLRELSKERKIIHNAGKQTYYSLKVDEPEAETIEQPIENTLSTAALEHEENMQQQRV